MEEAGRWSAVREDGEHKAGGERTKTGWLVCGDFGKVLGYEKCSREEKFCQSLSWPDWSRWGWNPSWKQVLLKFVFSLSPARSPSASLRVLSGPTVSSSLPTAYVW